MNEAIATTLHYAAKEPIAVTMLLMWLAWIAITFKRENSR